MSVAAERSTRASVAGARGRLREPLRRRIRRIGARIDGVYPRLAGLAREPSPLPASAQWLLDNHFAVRRALAQVRSGLGRGLTRELPAAPSDDRGHAVPAVYALAREVCERGDHLIDLDELGGAVSPKLRVAELWALPLMLRLVLLEAIAEDAPAITEGDDRPEVDRRVARCVRSLLMIGKADWRRFFERTSTVHMILRRDPSDDYTRMDFATRDRYRKAVERLARTAGVAEAVVATTAVELAAAEDASAHVGEWLVGRSRAHLRRQLGIRDGWRCRGRAWARAYGPALYTAAIGAVAAAPLGALVWVLGRSGVTAPLAGLVGVAAAVPMLTVASLLVDWIVTLIVPARVLPKLDLSEGIGEQRRTLVVIPALVAGPRDVDALVAQLERHRIANPEAGLIFAIAGDFADADAETTPGDEALLRRARARIAELDARYAGADGPVFHLLWRRRVWSERQGRFMGWERKRGKLEELNRWLRGDRNTSYLPDPAPAGTWAAIRYVVTLDADTVLPRGGARRLVETAAHPLNRPRWSGDRSRIVAGYSVIQPRSEPLPGSAVTRFSRTFGGDAGYDIYTRAVSDVYQDLFGEGTFVGKGIYEVDAFLRATADVPGDRVLSHDLLEGALGRAALASDIVVYEEYPANWIAYARRLHRWVRGDWQLVPWLGRRRPGRDGARPNRLSWLSRYKILDNLRRSLLAPSLVALLVLAWGWLPGPAWLWSLGVAIVLATPVLTDLGGAVVRGARPGRLRAELAGTPSRVAVGVARWLLRAAWLMHEALVTLDAIARALVRSWTGRNTLQWRAAAEVGRDTHAAAAIVWATASATLGAVAVAVGLWALRPGALVGAAPWLVAWLAAPALVAFTARARPRPVLPEGRVDRAALRRLARRTWLFFETYVGPDDHWLPPDNVQYVPAERIAHRTSPTNIGMGLLATISAYDLGYIDLLELVLRLQSTLDTCAQLPRHEGHFLNWYDTTTLEPLEPRYVSSVDSGNVAAALWVVEQACLEIADGARPLSRRVRGLRDTLDVIASSVDGPAASPVRAVVRRMVARTAELDSDPGLWIPVLDALAERDLPDLDDALLRSLDARTPGSEPAGAAVRTWAVRLRAELSAIRNEIEGVVPWVAVLATCGVAEPAAEAARRALPRIPPLGSAQAAYRDARERLTQARAGATEDARSWLGTLMATLDRAAVSATELRERLHDLAVAAARFVAQMDFRAVYDPARSLLYIGYDLGAGALDAHHYDLLASEARMASLVAIAKGDVPVEHWNHLGRPIGRYGGGRGLLSWGGTMFEFLMPPLLVAEPPDSLLGATARAVVRAQRDHAAALGIPWGISESGYARVDERGDYQYQAFGVPELGFKRSLAQDRVVAPYASVIAVSIDPGAVCDNLAVFERMGAMDAHGLYEAIDFTAEHVPVGDGYRVVRSHMSHHQGMVVLALAGFLDDARMVARLRRSPAMRTVEVLVREPRPGRVSLERAQPVEAEAEPSRSRAPALHPWPARAEPGRIDAHVLGNGRLGVVATASGGGFSWWRGHAITAYSGDPTLGDPGLRIHLEDLEDGRRFELGATPRAGAPRVEWSAHAAHLETRHAGIVAGLRVAVAGDDDVELRRVRIVNPGPSVRRLRIVTHAEVVLGDASVHARHPAFSRLFVVGEVLPARDAVVLTRREREPGREAVWLVHRAVGRTARVTGYEIDRARLFARGHAPLRPAIATRPMPPQTRAETPLDPVVAIEVEVEVAAGSTTDVAFVTAVAGSREAALAASDRFATLGAVDRGIDDAAEREQRDAVRRGHEAEDLCDYQRLLAAVLYPRRALRATPEVLAANRRGQSSLWRHGISGDLPIVAVLVPGSPRSTLLQHVVRAHRMWRDRGVAIDLVLVDDSTPSYDDASHGRLTELFRPELTSAPSTGRRGAMFVVRGAGLEASERALLLASSAVVLHAGADSLASALTEPDPRPAELPPFQPSGQAPAATKPLARPTDLRFDNGLGGFSPDGRRYVIHLEPGRRPPAPWINVIANPTFGCIVSEAGAGYTWADNAGLNRLTPWFNDPVCDPGGEAVYIRDELDGEVWSPTPAPAPAPAPYRIEHAAGCTTFHQRSHGLIQQLEVFVAPDAPIKLVRLRLTETWGRPRRLTVTSYVEWVLGTTRSRHAPFVVPHYASEAEVMLARNPYNEDFSEAWAFHAADSRLHGLTGDREEFLGAHGDRAAPPGLQRIGLSGHVPVGGDPCSALQVHVDLEPGGTAQATFLLGEAGSREAALALVARFRESDAVEACRRDVETHWERRLGAVQVDSPDPALNLMLSHWLPYQCIASRLWGRTGFYQSSGAFGFRDQLQDVMALMHLHPATARAHVLEAAAHQYVEGDVMHWWHPPTGRGLRSRCSDDLLWLPFVVAHYVEGTGDVGILDEPVAFVQAPKLPPESVERYDASAERAEPASLYEHCRRAVLAAATQGPTGLPQIGSGDWNDGMNRLGPRGRGESTWLGWFIHATATAFAALAGRVGREADAARMRAIAGGYEAPLAAAWDGAWYRRATNDAGRAVGSADADQCRIDSIAQSWAVIAGAGDRARAREAMDRVWDELVDEEAGIVRLLRPPFDRSELDPGYIEAYPPGIRENGGQYTHAGVWVAWAYAELGQPERALAVLRMLLPVHHATDPEAVARYRVEPYAIAADIYGGSGHVGRGGWTWYTGAAAWAFRCGLEQILGVRRRDGRIRIEPAIPADWPGYRVVLREGETTWDIEVVRRGPGADVHGATLDGVALERPVVLGPADGRHHVVAIELR